MKLANPIIVASVILASSVALATDYTVDPVHSSAIFRIRHMNTSWVYGRINDPQGTIGYDPAAPEKSSFAVTLKAAEIDTHNADRDKHLKSPAFFNAKEYPTLSFKSTAVKKTDETHLKVTGMLTLRGVTKSLTIPMEISGTGKDMKGNAIIGFETTFTIKRSDFGMKEMLNLIGDEVRIIVSLEAVKKDSAWVSKRGRTCRNGEVSKRVSKRGRSCVPVSGPVGSPHGTIRPLADGTRCRHLQDQRNRLGRPNEAGVARRRAARSVEECTAASGASRDRQVVAVRGASSGGTAGMAPTHDTPQSLQPGRASILGAYRPTGIRERSRHPLALQYYPSPARIPGTAGLSKPAILLATRWLCGDLRPFPCPCARSVAAA